MDAYLEIAIAVLRAARRPLSPQAILAAAYRSGMVPSHLHGKAQHKTLQARLSEDIIGRREHSAFFRTAPGRFFLREFLTDTSLPDEFRRPVPTRRRIRELICGPVLAVDQDVLESTACRNIAIQPDAILKLLSADCHRYDDPRRTKNDGNTVFLRSFVCVRRLNQILTYRLGRYRDDRDTFMSKRSLGFSTFVTMSDRTLFNVRDFGIVEAGVSAAKIDLDFPEVPASERTKASLAYFVWAHEQAVTNEVLAVVRFECPAWFEPTKRRLALNDLRWMDSTTPVNNLDDFDPWSKTVLMAGFDATPYVKSAVA